MLFGEIKKRSQVPAGLFFLVMGDVKVGKTTFASTIQELGLTVLVNFENRVAHIPETENLRIFPQSDGDERIDTPCTTALLYELCKRINNEENNPEWTGYSKIKNIIIDTGDEWFDIMKDETLVGSGKVNITFDQREQIYNDMLYVFKFFKRKRINVVMTSHTKKDEETGKITCQFAAKLKRKVNQLTDFMFYLDIAPDKRRCLYTGNHPLYQCGQSMEQGKQLPDVIFDPTFKVLMEYFIKNDEPDNADEPKTTNMAKGK